MRRFAALYRRLDRSTATGDKRAALIDYFREAPPEDAAWALWLLSGGKIGGARAKIAGTNELRDWIRKRSLRQQGVDELRQVWQAALQDKSPGVSADEVLERLERKYQAIADRNDRLS